MTLKANLRVTLTACMRCADCFDGLCVRACVCVWALEHPRGSENWRLQKLRAMTKLWQQHAISNYEYLMFVNSAADRTCYDLTQYPVFPWVVADYTSATLNLNDPGTCGAAVLIANVLTMHFLRLWRTRSDVP